MVENGMRGMEKAKEMEKGENSGKVKGGLAPSSQNLHSPPGMDGTEASHLLNLALNC